jgi:hypothetical protein
MPKRFEQKITKGTKFGTAEQVTTVVLACGQPPKALGTRGQEL